MNAHKNMRHLVIAIAIVKLGDAARADHVHKLAEAARPLGDGHGENRFVALAQFAALGHMAQAVEIHVCAAAHGNQRFIGKAVLRDVGF